MQTLISHEEMQRRIQQKYGVSTPQTMYYLIGSEASSDAYCQEAEQVQYQLFGDTIDRRDAMRLQIEQQGPFEGKIVLQIVGAKAPLYQITFNQEYFPLIRVGREQDKDEPVVWLINLV